MQLHPLLLRCVLAELFLRFHHSGGRYHYIPLKSRIVGHPLDHYIGTFFHRLHQQSTFLIGQDLDAAHRAGAIRHVEGVDGLAPVVQLFLLGVKDFTFYRHFAAVHIDFGHFDDDPFHRLAVQDLLFAVFGPWINHWLMPDIIRQLTG